jgi:hypothetical protein
LVAGGNGAVEAHQPSDRNKAETNRAGAVGAVGRRGLACLLDAVVVAVCLGAVAADSHEAPAAGPVAGGVVEPQHAGGGRAG